MKVAIHAMMHHSTTERALKEATEAVSETEVARKEVEEAEILADSFKAERDKALKDYEDSLELIDDLGIKYGILKAGAYFLNQFNRRSLYERDERLIINRHVGTVLLHSRFYNPNKQVNSPNHMNETHSRFM